MMILLWIYLGMVFGIILLQFVAHNDIRGARLAFCILGALFWPLYLIAILGDEIYNGWDRYLRGRK